MAVERMRILLIEDDEDVREILAEDLRVVGYDVETAKDGAVGWTALEQGKLLPDVIVLDLLMPNMNGHELRIRQLADPRTASIPTVVFTGTPINPHVRARLGLVPVIEKPASFVVILATIAAALDGSKRRTGKICACGVTYDSARWRLLRKVGEIDNGREVGEWLELRNCAACESTLAWEVGVHAISVPPDDG